MRARRRSHLSHAVRVAAAATLLIVAAYAAVSITFDLLDARHLVAQVDTHLVDRLADVSHRDIRQLSPSVAGNDHEVEGPPVVLWRVDANGRTVPLSDGAPRLTSSDWSPSGRPTTARLASMSFRLQAARVGSDWLVAGQSLAETNHVENVLVAGEVIAGPVLLLAAFLGALVIGLKASRPLETARRRQLEFTADASHELRTPLTVIEAETSLALSTERSVPEYQETLQRVSAEGRRLRRIVQDLLWLARLDSDALPPGNEPIDLATIAESCANRFGAIAESQGITIAVRHPGEAKTWIDAPPELIDRLGGVLLDNACRYAGPGGMVEVIVTTHGTWVSLVVEDSGPGIPVEEWPRLFDRFHRATDEGSGSGLGLAIADSVVRATNGRWHIADAALGGAHMEVAWHRSNTREPGAGPPTTEVVNSDPRTVRL